MKIHVSVLSGQDHARKLAPITRALGFQGA